MKSPREVIEDIRRSEYGIGEPTNVPALPKMRARQHRTLQQLAEEIYSDGTHFVLELIQNAEDNEYAERDPSLTFSFSETLLHVWNNETGFGEESVRALCDVACSTKVKGKGHIGEKGIGFKSVFRVTDEPLVFSNGYQFRLPKYDPEAGLGYVVPSWVDGTAERLVPGVTNILLPLNATARAELAKLTEIKPTLLLFLKKLRVVEIIDEVRGQHTRVSKHGPDERVELRSGEKAEFWKIVREVVPVPSGLQEEKRRGVTETEVALALPLKETGAADGSRTWPVHGFLPIREAGFRFAFHADFVLAASREAILTDRPWNQWLRDQLPALFMQAVEQCKRDEQFRKTFMAYVPRTAEEIDPFFRDAAESIRETLRGAECVLTASGRWAKPRETLIADEAIRSLVSNEDAARLLGKEFVSPEYQADALLLRSLGASRFTVDDLIQCLNSAEWVSEQPDEWFTRLFAYLGSPDLEERIEEFGGLPILPLEGGGLTSVDEAADGVFLPLSRGRKYGFESGLAIVRNSVVGSRGSRLASNIFAFLRQLGVRTAKPVDLIQGHIQPVFDRDDEETGWRSKTDDFLHGCIDYIKDYWEHCKGVPGLVGRLRKSLILRVAGRDNLYQHPTHLYLSKPYGNTNKLESLFKGIEGIWFVDPVYLNRSFQRLKQLKVRAKRGKVTRADRERLREQWARFLTELGLDRLIRIVPKPESDKPDQAESPDLQKVIQTQEPARIVQALSLLDSNWSAYAQWEKTQVTGMRRGRQVTLTPTRTTFGQLLTESTWIPVIGGMLAEPGDVFVDSPSTRELLGDEALYLAAELNNQEFIKFLGIHSQLTIPAVLNRLRELARTRNPNTEAFNRLYTFLEAHNLENPHLIRVAFLNDRLIFLPGERPRFLTIRQVFWKDVSVLFGNDRGYLEVHYRNRELFFCHQLEVPDSPSAEDYADRLRTLAQEGSCDASRAKVIWALYRELDRFLKDQDEREEILDNSWWEEFIDEPIFLTESGAFSARDGVYANDREDYAELFRGKSGIEFLQVPAARLPQVRHLLRAGGLQFLTEAVQCEPIAPETAEANAALTERLRALVPFIFRYLHHQEPDLYERLKATGKLGRFPALQARTCPRPLVRFTLGQVAVEVEWPVVITEDHLYVRPDTVEDSDALGIALSAWLCNPKGLDGFLITLLDRRDEAKVLKHLKNRGIPELPREETELLGEAILSEEFGRIPSQFDQRSVANPPGFDPVPVEGQTVVAVSGPHPVSPLTPLAASDQPAPHTIGQPLPVAPTIVTPRVVNSGGSHSSPPPLFLPRPTPTAGGQVSQLARDWREECSPEEAEALWATFEPAGSARSCSPALALAALPAEWPARAMPSEEEPPDVPHEVRAEIGYWGEKYAVRLLILELRKKYPNAIVEDTQDGYRLLRDGSVMARVVWLNRHGEKGQGCDIEVTESAGTLFVEVKSTSDDRRACFDLSGRQWEEAKARGPGYRITRVYNACCRHARAMHFNDPYRLWQQGELKVRSLQVVL